MTKSSTCGNLLCMSTVAFGEILRKRRRESGLNQRDLAKRVGVDFSYISKLENGRLPAPAVKTIVRLSEVMGASVDEFLHAANKLPTPSVNQAHRGGISRTGRYAMLQQIEVVMFGADELATCAPQSYYMQLFHGLQMEAGRHDGARLSVRAWSKPTPTPEMLEALRRRDGIILTGALHKQMGCVEPILDLGVPVVLAGRQIGGKDLDCVLSDYYPACQQLVDYLFDMGFRRFGWYGKAESPPHYEYRLDMIRGRLASKNLYLQPKDCRFHDYKAKARELCDVFKEWILKGDLPEVVICSNGNSVPHIQRAMAATGVRCPEDLSIVCFDNSDFVKYCDPEPTRMATFPAEIGRRSFRRMLEIITDPDEKNRPATIMVPTRFIEGPSVRKIPRE